jgi:hypothetical protein
MPAAVAEKRHQAGKAEKDEDNRLEEEAPLDNRVEKGGEKALVGLKYRKVEKDEKRKSQGKERRRKKGNPGGAAGKELDNQKPKRGGQGDEKTISASEAEGGLSEKGESDPAVDVEVGQKKRQEEREKQSAEEGVGQNLEDFHSENN